LRRELRRSDPVGERAGARDSELSCVQSDKRTMHWQGQLSVQQALGAGQSLLIWLGYSNRCAVCDIRSIDELSGRALG
jgi:hypothetical protein